MVEDKIEVTRDMVVSCVWAIPAGVQESVATALILGHGAGSDMNNPFLSFVHAQLAGAGVLAVKFNFPYKERGAKAPDRPLVLAETWRAVIEAVRRSPRVLPARLFVGGKSMGGRIASQVVADGADCAGLVFLGYPLHAASKPHMLRTGHWPRLHRPMLFIQGTRDRLCDLDLLRRQLQQVTAPVTLHVIEGGDHSFSVPVSQRRSAQSVWREIVDVVGGWLKNQT